MRRAVFLDRDGTLIEDVGYLGDPAGVAPIPGVHEALGLLRAAGWLVVIVTNQSGVARGYYTPAEYRAVDREVTRVLGPFDAAYAAFCHESGAVQPWMHASRYRKPDPGMLQTAAEDLGVDLAQSVMVGDNVSDVAAGRAAGARPVLVRTGGGLAAEPDLGAAGLGDVDVVDDLLALARELTAETPSGVGSVAVTGSNSEVPA